VLNKVPPHLFGDQIVSEAQRLAGMTSVASEIQQNLLPPRIARISGGILAGNVLPGYEIGGDWFDYVENRDGAWLGVADSLGHGTTAAALGGVALGAFRAKRKLNAKIDASALSMHQAIREIPIDGALVNAIICRWHGPTSTFRWITCGHQPPLLITTDGHVLELEGAHHEALGLGEHHREFHIDRRRLEPGERLLLISDGVLERRTHDGGAFGVRGVRDAIAHTEDTAAAPTVRALQDAITAASGDPLHDDATIVVFAPSSPQQ